MASDRQENLRMICLALDVNFRSTSLNSLGLRRPVQMGIKEG